MTGSVIQATRTAKFEDGLRTGVQFEVRLDPYSDRSKPMVIAKKAKMHEAAKTTFYSLDILGYVWLSGWLLERK